MPSILLVILTERIRKSVHGARKHVNGHPNAETISEVTERQLPLKISVFVDGYVRDSRDSSNSSYVI